MRIRLFYRLPRRLAQHAAVGIRIGHFVAAQAYQHEDVTVAARTVSRSR